MIDTDVIIVGAGLAGLCCAKQLQHAGVPWLLLEGSDRPGGRVKTDRVEGFLLDRGFQVLLTAYPEAQRTLDYAALDLKRFYPGSLVRVGDRFHRIADPWRRPIAGALSLLNPIGSPLDKLRVAHLRSRAMQGSIDELFERPECASRWVLTQLGFSHRMIERFFEPFLGGVFLDPSLHTSSRMMEFVFRMFATGDIALPASGMEAIPRQLAAPLPTDRMMMNARVTAMTDHTVKLHDGRTLRSKLVVLATDASTTARLMQRPAPAWSGVRCLYFAAEKSPIAGPMLLLNGQGKGLVNNLAVLSEVAPSYAPPGAALISVTVLRSPPVVNEHLEAQIVDELGAWFGSSVSRWRLLRHDHIPHALPLRHPPTMIVSPDHDTGHDWLLICGDHREHASIQGAMVSGRRAAEIALRKLGLSERAS
jgi:phytoene dehydrogenase-like protein